jgi:MFS family permease
MLILGVGAAFAFMAVILASTTGVPENEAGLASGLVNTSQQMGGALGLAVLAAVAAAYTAVLAGPNPDAVAALNSGYHAAFLAGAGCVLLGRPDRGNPSQVAPPGDRGRATQDQTPPADTTAIDLGPRRVPARAGAGRRGKGAFPGSSGSRGLLYCPDAQRSLRGRGEHP